MRRFEAQTVLVTGASRGLGRAIALAFAAEGAYVLLGYLTREADALESLRLAREAGGDGALLPFNVSDRDAVERAIGAAAARQGGIDVLVNNAAIRSDALFSLIDAARWDEVLAVNLDGVFHCCRAVVRPMVARRRGAIINVASVAALRAVPGQASYATSKAAVLTLTRTLAAELAPRGVRVNAVIPGLLTTGEVERLDPRVTEQRRRSIPLGRLGDAAEIAHVVLFLASSEASYVVGQAFVVDGGLAL